MERLAESFHGLLAIATLGHDVCLASLTIVRISDGTENSPSETKMTSARSQPASATFVMAARIGEEMSVPPLKDIERRSTMLLRPF